MTLGRPAAVVVAILQGSSPALTVVFIQEAGFYRQHVDELKKESEIYEPSGENERVKLVRRDDGNYTIDYSRMRITCSFHFSLAVVITVFVYKDCTTLPRFMCILPDAETFLESI